LIFFSINGASTPYVPTPRKFLPPPLFSSPPPRPSFWNITEFLWFGVSVSETAVKVSRFSPRRRLMPPVFPPDNRIFSHNFFFSSSYGSLDSPGVPFFFGPYTGFLEAHGSLGPLLFSFWRIVFFVCRHPSTMSPSPFLLPHFTHRNLHDTPPPQVSLFFSPSPQAFRSRFVNLRWAPKEVYITLLPRL